MPPPLLISLPPVPQNYQSLNHVYFLCLSFYIVDILLDESLFL